MPKLRSVLVCLSLVAALAVAQRGTPAKSTTPSTNPKDQSKGQARLSDAGLESVIRAKLAASKIGVNHFTVHVQGGIATLEGKTEVVQHKGTATRLAKNAGALAVNNRIQVSDAGKKKASDNLETGRRRAQVTRGESRSQTATPKK